MNKNNFDSFEKVDLLSPVELTPISEIEPPFEAPTTSDADSSEDIGKGNLEKLKSTEAIERKYSDNQTLSGLNNVNRESNVNHTYNNTLNYVSSPNGFQNNPQADPNRFFREEEELKKKLKANRELKSKLIISGIAFAAMFILSFLFMRGVMSNVAKKTTETKEELPSVITIKDSPIQNDYEQDYVYGILEYDSSDRLNSDLVTFNPDIIEFTGAYQRTLYFRISPEKENVAVQVNVQMYDRYGNTIGNESGSKMPISKGSSGIIPVTFKIDPLMDLNDVTYKISSSAYEIQGEPSYNTITQLEQAPGGYMRIYMEGDKYLNKEAYVVSYKNDKVISVDRYSADILETKAILYCDIGTELDQCEVYY